MTRHFSSFLCTMARTHGWTSIIIIADPATLRRLPGHLKEGIKEYCVNTKLSSEALELQQMAVLLLWDNRPHLAHTQGTFAFHRVTQFHHASPSPLCSAILPPPPFVDDFFSLDVCQSVSALTSFHPTPVRSIAEFFYVKQVITWKLSVWCVPWNSAVSVPMINPVDKITAMQQCQKAILILMPAYFCQPVTPMYQVSISHWPERVTKSGGWNCQVLSASRCYFFAFLGDPHPPKYHEPSVSPWK